MKAPADNRKIKGGSIVSSTPCVISSLPVYLCFLIVFPLFLHAGNVYAENPDAKVTVTADSIKRNNKTGITEAEGDVMVKYGDKSISGDTGEFDMQNRKGLMEGNVILTLPHGVIKGSRMEMDMDSALGTIDNAEGLLNSGIKFTAKKAERVSQDRYLIDEGSLTSCLSENPEWIFKSDHINLKLEGIATFRNVAFRFYDVPIFYAPYWFASAVTKRTSGLLMPELGFSSTDGAYVSNSFFWAISDQDDATLTLGLLGERGLHEGLEYRYAFAQRTRGQLNIDYIDDSKLDRELWSVKYDHRHKFTEVLDSRARLDMESDTSYSREFDTGLDLGTRRYTDSFFQLEGGGPETAVSMMVRNRVGIEKSRDETFAILPELSITRMPHTVFNTPIVGEASATATSFRSEIKVDPVTDIDINRLDMRTKLSLPYPLMKDFNVMPWAEGAVTYYSRNTVDGESISTEYYSAGLAAEGPRFFRVFEAKGGLFKHLVTPKLDYSYTPGFELDGEDRNRVHKFDMLDNSDPESMLTFSLLNRVLGKKEKGGLASEIVRLEIRQGYDFNEAARDGTGRRPFANMFVDLDSRPLDWFLYNADLTYNHYDGRLDTINHELGMAMGDSIYLSYDRRYTRSPESIYSTGLIGFKAGKRFKVEASAAYDEAAKEYTSSMLSIGYQSCCWGLTLSLSARDRTEESADGSVRRENETRFFINFSLKGIGDLGEKPGHAINRKL